MEFCPYCSKPIKENLTQCPHCGAPVNTSNSTIKITSIQQNQHFCPNCNSPVNKTDIICLNCGTNLLTGEKIAQQEPKVKISFPFSEYKNYIIAGTSVIVLLILAGIGIIFLTYDPLSNAINMSKTNILGAIDTVQKYIEKHPKNIRALILLGKLYINNQQYNEAIATFDKVLQIDNKNKDAIWLGLYASSQRPIKKEKILTYLQHLQSLNPEKKEINLLLGLAKKELSEEWISPESINTSNIPKSYKPGILALLLKQNKFTEAENLLLVEPDSIKKDLMLLLLQEMDQSDKEKIYSLVSKLKNTPEEISDPEIALLACELVNMSDHETALRFLQNIKNRENLPLLTRYLRALILLKTGLTNEAITELEQLINTEGEVSIISNLELAHFYLNQDNLQKATELLQSAKNKTTRLPARAYLIEGLIALQNNDFSLAQQSFKNALQTDPQYVPAYLENGLLNIRKGNIGEGLRNLKQYVQLVKSNYPTHSTAEIEVLIEQIEQTQTTTSNIQDIL